MSSYTNKINYSLNITGGNLNVSGSSSLGSLNATSSTIPQLVATNVSAGSLNAGNATLTGPLVSSGLTTGNINFTGSLYQNGTPYLGSQWTSTAGNVSYTSGSVVTDNIVSNTIQLTSTTNANNSSTGALVVSGGIGVAGKIHANEAHLGTTVISGDLTVTGSTITLQSETQVINDNLLVLNSGPDGLYDSGLMINLTTGSYATMFYDTDTEHFHFAHTSSDPGAASVVVEHYIGLRGQHIDIVGTDNASGLGTGGSLTTLGGASVQKDMYVGGTLNAEKFVGSNAELTIQTVGTSRITSSLIANGNSNTIGSIITNNSNVDINGQLVVNTFSAGNALVVKDNGYIGINKQNPMWNLNVVGTAGIEGSLTVQQDASGNNKQLYISDTNNIMNSLSLGYFAQGNIAVIEGSGNTSVILNRYGGNVGIATTSPTYTLDVNGTFEAANTSGSLVFSSNGNVGIGTTSPSFPLHVSSTGITNANYLFSTNEIYSTTTSIEIRGARNANFANSLATLRLSNYDHDNLVAADLAQIGAFQSSTTDNANGALTFFTRTSGNVTEKMRINHNGDIGIGTNSPSQRLHVSGGNIYLSSAPNSAPTYQVLTGNTNGGGMSWNDGSLTLDLQTINVAYPIAIRGSQVHLVPSGNVGIGTTAPATKLHVSGSGSAQSIRIQTTTQHAAFVETLDGNGVNARLQSNISSAFIGTTSNHPFALFSNNTERIIINTSGNVGIGTTAPATALQINSDNIALTLRSSSLGYNATYPQTGLAFKVGVSGDNYTVAQIIGKDQSPGTTYIGDLIFNVVGQTGTSNLSECMRIKGATGNVGINNSNPAYTLDINGTFDISNSNGSLVFASTGNVGIGTTAPISLLHLSSPSLAILRIGGDSTNTDPDSGNIMAQIQLRADGTAAEHGWNINHHNYAGSSGFSLDEVKNGASNIRFFILNDGNIGISTTTPTSTLDVNGTFKASNSNGSLVFASTGNVGIGTSTAGYKLVVSGDIYATGDIIAYSDQRLKTDVSTISNALDKVKSMRGVNYTLIKDGKRSLGLIAQEVQQILPELVAEKEEYLGVAYGNIVGLLVEAIKELSDKLDNLEQKLN